MPRFTHDCDACVFKGSHGRFDIWYCERCDGGTWIARYGSDGPEYASYPTFVLDIHRERATESRSLAAIFAAGA
jgi:ribosomal protein L37AE/L43A